MCSWLGTNIWTSRVHIHDMLILTEDRDLQPACVINNNSILASLIFFSDKFLLNSIPVLGGFDPFFANQKRLKLIQLCLVWRVLQSLLPTIHLFCDGKAFHWVVWEDKTSFRPLDPFIEDNSCDNPVLPQPNTRSPWSFRMPIEWSKQLSHWSVWWFPCFSFVLLLFYYSTGLGVWF